MRIAIEALKEIAQRCANWTGGGFSSQELEAALESMGWYAEQTVMDNESDYSFLEQTAIEGFGVRSVRYRTHYFDGGFHKHIWDYGDGYCLFRTEPKKIGANVEVVEGYYLKNGTKIQQPQIQQKNGVWK